MPAVETSRRSWAAQSIVMLLVGGLVGFGAGYFAGGGGRPSAAGPAAAGAPGDRVAELHAVARAGSREPGAFSRTSAMRYYDREDWDHAVAAYEKARRKAPAESQPSVGPRRGSPQPGRVRPGGGLFPEGAPGRSRSLAVAPELAPRRGVRPARRPGGPAALRRAQAAAIPTSPRSKRSRTRSRACDREPDGQAGPLSLRPLPAADGPARTEDLPRARSCSRRGRPGAAARPAAIREGEMVRDPVCGTWIDRGIALTARQGGPRRAGLLGGVPEIARGGRMTTTSSRTTPAAARRRERPSPPATPLADRMRPRSLDEVEGPEEVVGANGFLRRAIAEDRVPSLILWGPPGVGQDDARAPDRVADVVALPRRTRRSPPGSRRCARSSRRRGAARARQGKRTILFLDEIHRFNRVAAGRLPALRRGGRHRARRRDDGEPVLRAERRAAVALQGRRPRAAGARRRSRGSSSARSRDSPRGLGARDFRARRRGALPSSRRPPAATRAGR